MVKLVELVGLVTKVVFHFLLLGSFGNQQFMVPPQWSVVFNWQSPAQVWLLPPALIKQGWGLLITGIAGMSVNIQVGKQSCNSEKGRITSFQTSKCLRTTTLILQGWDPSSSPSTLSIAKRWLANEDKQESCQHSRQNPSQYGHSNPSAADRCCSQGADSTNWNQDDDTVDKSNEEHHSQSIMRKYTRLIAETYLTGRINVYKKCRNSQSTS